MTPHALKIKNSFIKKKVNTCFSKKARFTAAISSPNIFFNNSPKINSTMNKKQLFNYIIKRNISFVNSFTKNKKTPFCFLTKINFHKRSLFSIARAAASKATHVYSTTVTNNIPQRSQSYICAGRMNFSAPKPKAKDIDTSNKHMLGLETVCNKPECKTINCSQQKNQCSLHISQQPIQNIPPTGTPEDFETYIVANTTHGRPPGKKIIVLDNQFDYHAKPRAQNAVIESTPPKIDPKDVQVDPKASTYLQDATRHKILSQANNAHHSIHDK